ncbi:MAG: hypothetical protein EHM31_12405 [Candidatus Aminicenantes bacterium]|nr:MAG: hypothetical protein EHM31_12405 [Candidatus Aminicenantes bacterium]
MPEEQTQIKIDKTNLLKAGKIPVIAAAIGGALWLLGALGGILGILFWVIAAFAGYWYADQVLKSGAKPPILDVIVNGAILGAVVGLVYAVVTWIAISVRFSGIVGLAYRWGFGSIIRIILEGGIGGAIGAAGWFAYKTGMIKTK